MSPTVSLTFDAGPWQQALAALGKRGPVAVARGLTRTATSERTAMARAVAADMGLKVSTARNAMTVVKASSASLVSQVVARGKRIPLMEFKARGPVPSRGKAGGVSYTMFGQRKRIANAFIAVVRRAGTDGDEHAGHTGVFVRLGKKRLPIKQLYGPSIAKVFGTVVEVGAARRAEVLEKNVAHEIQFELSRLQQA